MFQYSDLDLTNSVSFLIALTIGVIGVAFFTGFAVKKLLHFMKSV